jgi:hypothetical protein
VLAPDCQRLVAAHRESCSLPAFLPCGCTCHVQEAGGRPAETPRHCPCTHSPDLRTMRLPVASVLTMTARLLT